MVRGRKNNRRKVKGVGKSKKKTTEKGQEEERKKGSTRAKS